MFSTSNIEICLFKKFTDYNQTRPQYEEQNQLSSDEEPNLQQPETNQARCNHVSFFEKLIM